MGLTVAPLTAQETYQSEKLIANDLNGTARYVGMGGAMEALGADISTINTNPAGIGLFRKSQIAVSGGFVAQSNAKTSFSYDNVPFNFKGTRLMQVLIRPDSFGLSELVVIHSLTLRSITTRAKTSTKY